MNIHNAIKLMQSYADIYPEANLTFANNKVPVTKIVFDEKTNSINLR